MTHGDWLGTVGKHLTNHITPIDRLRARGYITQVTDKTYETGYVQKEADKMAALIIIAIVIIGLAALDAASMAWGVDSRDSFRDDRR